jgi:hypothetical protein
LDNRKGSGALVGHEGFFTKTDVFIPALTGKMTFVLVPLYPDTWSYTKKCIATLIVAPVLLTGATLKAQEEPRVADRQSGPSRLNYELSKRPTSRTCGGSTGTEGR